MNICFVNGAYPPVNDGIGDYTAKLMDNLRKRNVNVSLITTDEKEIRNNIDNKYSSSIYPIIKKWNIFGVNSILRLVKKERFDIIHLQFPSTRYRKTLSLCLLPLLLRMFFKNIKVVCTLHEFSLSYPLNKLRQFFLVLFSHRVIITDRCDFKEVFKILPWGKKKIEVIPIGSNIDVCEYDTKKRDAFIKDLKLRAETKILSFFGVIHPNKGIETLLVAMRDLIRNNFPIHLVIISEPKGSVNRPYHKRIKDLVESQDIRNSVFWTGYIPPAEVSKYLSISHICVLPFTDGVTLRRGTLMAAFSHGVPVISTRSDRYIPDDLIEGENIILVPVEDARKLTEAIEMLCNNKGLRQRLGEGGRRLSKKFSWERIAGMHMDIYRPLTSE